MRGDTETRFAVNKKDDSIRSRRSKDPWSYERYVSGIRVSRPGGNKVQSPGRG